MNAQKVIELLGYSEKEAKVYLAVLALGEAHISDIAAKVKLPPSSVQIIADKLRKDGLLNFYIMRRYKYWVAENPERLLTTLKNKEQAVNEALPELSAIRQASWNKRKTKVARTADWEPFRILGDNSPQAILITNDKPQIVYVNNNWQKLFGYSTEEVVGEDPRVLQSGKTPRAVYEKMWKALRAELLFQSDEIIDKKRNGTLLHLLTTIIPVRSKGKLFYIQILDDISERKRVEETTRKLLSL